LNPEIMRPMRTMASCFMLALSIFLASVGDGYSQPASNRRPPLVLSAQQIILEEKYSEPYSQEGFTVTPASAIRDWVKTRLVADGTSGIIRVIILDARMTRQELKTKGGVRGWFTDDQKYRYDGRIHIRVEHQPASPGQYPSQAEAQSSGYFTMPEDATLNQLEKKAADLVQDLMQRTDLEIENNMLRHMPGVVR